MYDRQSRESFASFREDRNEVQGFVNSRVSSYARPYNVEDEEAIADTESSEVEEEEIEKPVDAIE